MSRTMSKLIILFVLYALSSVQCNSLSHQSLPEIKMIPTRAIPQICVAGNRELPPCGIGQFVEHQRRFDKKINKILQSYFDMIIDYKNPKNASVENYGPGKVYLESFDSLNRQLEEAERQKLLKQVNSTKIKENKQEFMVVNTSEGDDRETILTKDNSSSTDEDEDEAVNDQDIVEDEVEDFNFKTITVIEPSIIHIARVVRSLEKAVLFADECIPLGVQLCDDAYETTKIKKIQKRSVQSISEFFKRLSLSKIKLPGRDNSKEHKSVTDGLIEINPKNRREFFNRVDKRSISDDFNYVGVEDKEPKLIDLLRKFKRKK